jgi:hypothetical protein
LRTKERTIIPWSKVVILKCSKDIL